MSVIWLVQWSKKNSCIVVSKKSNNCSFVYLGEINSVSVLCQYNTHGKELEVTNTIKAVITKQEQLRRSEGRWIVDDCELSQVLEIEDT